MCTSFLLYYSINFSSRFATFTVFFFVNKHAEELEKMSKKMVEVENCEIPVVDEEFLDDAAKGAALLKIPTHTISGWGAPRHSLPADDTDYFGGGKSYKSTGTS